MLCDDANVRVLFAISLHCVDCRVVCKCCFFDNVNNWFSEDGRRLCIKASTYLLTCNLHRSASLRSRRSLNNVSV